MATEVKTNIGSIQVIQEKRTYSVPEIAEILQISKSKAYALCKLPLFKSMKIGKYVRISKPSFDNWLDRMDEKGD